jgi:hypothetical protein
MEYTIKSVRNVSRPGQAPVSGDVIEIETPTGFLPEVDPVTRQATGAPKQFRMVDDHGAVTPMRRTWPTFPLKSA